MRLFLAIYLAIYGGMHLYFFLKMRSLLSRSTWWLILLGAFCVLMIAAPIMARVLEKRGLFHFPRLIAFLGHTWMAVIMWFIAMAFLTDVWNAAIRAICSRMPSARLLALPPPAAMVGCWAVIGVLFLYGLYEASAIRVTRITLRTPKLSREAGPVRIAQISDLHLSLTLREDRLKKVIQVLGEAKPEIVVATGDMVDVRFQHAEHMARMLAELRPPLGKYAVLGNHEVYVGLEESLQFLDAAGFRVLRGESVLARKDLRLAGVDDPAARWAGVSGRKDENAALPPRSSPEFMILLKHRPTVDGESLGRFDLQLSGHHHGGQIFPFHFVVWKVHPFRAGLHRLRGGSHLYVSRGTGTWGPPLRLFSPPEVALITIEPES